MQITKQSTVVAGGHTGVTADLRGLAASADARSPLGPVVLFGQPEHPGPGAPTPPVHPAPSFSEQPDPAHGLIAGHEPPGPTEAGDGAFAAHVFDGANSGADLAALHDFHGGMEANGNPGAPAAFESGTIG